MHNVLEWLEASAAAVPGKPAFADEQGEVTFAQLEKRAQAAGSRIASTLEPRTPVAFFLEKSHLAICGMLGATYARCPYCVIDVRQPAARVASILETLRPGLIVTDAANEPASHELFDDCGIELVRLDALVDSPVDDELIANRRGSALDTDPLYINFTSGSTGTPKGVAVGHASVIDFIENFTELFGFSADDQIANQAPFDFDVSVKDIYSGLACGATVHLIPREYFSAPIKLMDFLVEREVTVCTWAVSAMCFVSIMGGFEYRVPEHIRTVIFSGEVMPPKQLSVWQRYLPNAQFVNVYGPTEVTCNCTYYRIEREFGPDEVIPMGVPFPNERVMVLDENDHEVKRAGEQGEICVCGACLALGYYNEPERTAKSFVSNPLADGYGERMYRTGDLAFYDEDGNLVYAGRKDHQIKHMGQRIELGEIDAAAQALDGVTRACTIYNDRKKRILLFYAGDVEKDALSEHLHEKLPSYMAPNKIFPLDEMPLNKNGKIDRTALAELGSKRRRK